MPESNTPINNPPSGQLVEINNESAFEIDPQLIHQVIGLMMADSKVDRFEVSVAIVDDPTIHRLNREFLQHDYETDVLSFLLSGSQQDGFLQGEVIVSHETASRSAGEFGWRPTDELMLYVIHGTLHLLGHDDSSDKLRAEMQQLETKFLRAIGIQRPIPSAGNRKAEGGIA